MNLKLCVFLFALPLFGWEYYSHGHLVSLTLIASFTKNFSPKYFLTSEDQKVGVDNKVLCRFKNLSCQQQFTKKYRSKKLSSGDMLLFVQGPKEAFDVSQKIYESGCALYAHPDFLIEPKKRSFDPLFNPLQWNLHNWGQYGATPDVDMDVYEAWQYASGKGVKVAVIDNGFDLSHPDLQGAFVAQTDLVDMDANASYDNPYEIHGTACAGLIAARKNGIGIQGIAYKSNLIGIKLIGSYANGQDRPLHISTILEAFMFADEMGAQVINCSWGTYDVADAVRYIIHKLATQGRGGKGIPIVFASGNEGRGQWYWADDESALPDVLAIGAVNDYGDIAWYSNYGPDLDFVAPSGGGNLAITTTDISGPLGYADGSFGHPDYCYATDITGFNGTSAAAPQVSGVIALMLQRDPDLTKDQIVHILAKTAKKIGPLAYENGRNDYFGYGLVDADDAIKEVIAQRVRREIKGKSFPIDGYFIHYGAGKFDWIYVSNNKKMVAKLAGMRGKYLRWDPILYNAFETIEIQNDRISFGQSSDPFGQNFADKSFVIDGYFVHYGQEAFDWIYITATTLKSYKFEGLGYKENFLWVPLNLKVYKKISQISIM